MLELMKLKIRMQSEGQDFIQFLEANFSALNDHIHETSTKLKKLFTVPKYIRIQERKEPF